MGTRIPDGRTEGPRIEKSRTDGSAASGKVKNVNKQAGAQNPKGASGNASARPGGAVAPGKNSGAGVPSKAVFANRENRSIESNVPLSSSFSQEPVLKSAIEPSGDNTVIARELFKQIAAALGFSQDVLSVSLIAFLRFFSLSADPAVFKTLRREILDSLKSSSPGSAKEKAALEAETLAAVIALDKGVELDQEVLERYVQYLTPAVFKENDPPRGNVTTAAADGDGEDPREELPEAEELRIIAEEQSSKDGFLDFLNSLPGKSDKHWTIFPFIINVRGTELKVFLRLLKREPFAPGESELLIADITGPKRQWRCFLRKNDGKIRADFQVFPGLSGRALKSLEKEAQTFFGKGTAGKTENVLGNFGGFGEIRVRNGEEIPSWVDDLCDEHVPSINEEV